MSRMYIAINRVTGIQETFSWTPANKLIIQGQEVDIDDWEIVQIEYKIIRDE